MVSSISMLLMPASDDVLLLSANLTSSLETGLVIGTTWLWKVSFLVARCNNLKLNGLVTPKT